MIKPITFIIMISMVTLIISPSSFAGWANKGEKYKERKCHVLDKKINRFERKIDKFEKKKERLECDPSEIACPCNDDTITPGSETLWEAAANFVGDKCDDPGLSVTNEPPTFVFLAYGVGQVDVRLGVDEEDGLFCQVKTPQGEFLQVKPITPEERDACADQTRAVCPDLFEE